MAGRDATAIQVADNGLGSAKTFCTCFAQSGFLAETIGADLLTRPLASVEVSEPALSFGKAWLGSALAGHRNQLLLPS